MSDEFNCDQPPPPETCSTIVEWVDIGATVRIGEYTIRVNDHRAGRVLVSIRRGKKMVDFLG